MIRFRDGRPEAIWYSQHATGQAFTYDAVEKEGPRVSQRQHETASGGLLFSDASFPPSRLSIALRARTPTLRRQGM